MFELNTGIGLSQDQIPIQHIMYNFDCDLVINITIYLGFKNE